ncbi:hypothetical protein [Chitinophaga nivalis]|uniref:Uncharacterized protein n=1 Tax=Chitinophaga nivalis TaxID=2991709 RepID=A0ABT3IIH7_9BACT|nr:hypothetical protein [Chitinophaga nivalis]MCW3466536.1 hypothetical protein [Chitinophaga nivalis]MCW3483773.1 hypothetical protein [Chitinophaga nivalis]
MGLDISHGAWHGPYSYFMRWRTTIAEKAQLGDLRKYEGYNGNKPLASIEKEGLQILLSHSDCDGELTPDECKKVADDLTDLLPSLSDDMHERTIVFIKGCISAFEKNETMYFG